jgi:hypothetical protein
MDQSLATEAWLHCFRALERDFTFKIYDGLLDEIKRTGREVFALRDYFYREDSPSSFFILRHDVDRRPENAVRMAQLENARGLRSTYYFRIRPGVFKEALILDISRLGHEIGYHYEVMDKAKGEISKAAEIFERELKQLRNIADVETACMHGNPLTPWDNRAFWQHYSLSQFDLLGEAYISLKGEDIFYATDTGRGWNRSGFNIKDRGPDESMLQLPHFEKTDDLIRVIREMRYDKIYLQSHPNRWSWNRLQWTRQWGEDMITNAAKWVLSHLRKGKARHEGTAH